MKASKFTLLLILLWAGLFPPPAAHAQSESHNFITYDTTYNVGYAGLYYIFRITRPKNMFVGGDPDWAARPAIIQMGGAGEVGSNAALTAVNGPHYWLANGWDGGVQLANGKHYPIIISVQANQDWPQTTELLNMLKYILSTYHIKSNSVHLCGLSMGAFSWSALICHQSTPGGEDGMKLVTSLVCLEGQSTTVSPAAAPNELGGATGFQSFGHWAKKYGGKFFGLEGTADYRNVGAVSGNMNDSVPGSAYFSYESIGGGAHCCWDNMYDPSVTNWTSVGTLAPNLATGASPNALGTYQAPMNIFQWMLSQGDVSLVGSGTPPTNTTPPTVSAGSAQTITLPATLTLSGSATPASGATIASYAWTEVSGPSTVSFSAAGAASTGVSGLQAGTYVFQLAATDNGSLTNTSTVTITVNAAASLPPTVSAGSAQNVTLPVALITLSGSATPAAGTTISSYSWSQVSGGVSVITTPNSPSTTITGLVAGTNVYRLTAMGSNGVSASSTVQVQVNPAATLPLPGTGLTVKTVITCEYRTWYIGSDNNVYSWNNGSLNVQQFAIGGRKAMDGAGAFNEFRVLDDQGYIWTSKIDFTTNTTRFDTDSSGAPFNNNVAVYAYGNSTATIKADGSVWMFGNDTLHMFHTTGAVNMSPMQLSPAGLVFTKLVMGNRLVGLTNTGDVYEWTYGGSRTPTKKTIPSPAIDIFGSHLDYFGCIIPATPGGTTGYPYVWGTANRAWGGTAAYTQPTSVQTLWGVQSPIAQISADWNTTHYIDDQGRMWGFGFNVNGEVGNGKEMANQYNYTVPYSWDFTDYAAPSGLPFQQIGVGVKWSKFFSNNFFCFYKYAVDVNDSVYSWGRNKAMVLGNAMINQQEQYYPNALDVLTPTMVHPLTAIYQPYTFTMPSLSAGTNQNITTTSTTLAGTVKAPLLVKTTSVAANHIDTAGYKIVSYLWTKVSGTGGTITSPNLLNTTVTGLTPGTYVFNLLTTDNNTGTLSSNITVTVSTPGASTPVANAGSDQTITLPTNSVTLTGTGSETGGTIVSYAWSQVSGPSTASFAAATQAQTGVSALVAGSYIFQLTVKDNSGVTATDVVTVTVNPAAVVPGPPSANAGADQTITLPTNSVTLTGSGSETNGTIKTYSWIQMSGPSNPAIATAGQAQTGVTGLVAGTYVFRLTVTDNSNVSASDDITITVKPAPVVPGAPIANAGADQTIGLPTSSVTLAGSGSETNGTIVSYQWTEVSGPSPAPTISSATQAQTGVTGLVAGTYIFRLTIKDNSGVTASDDVTVTVNAAPVVPGAPVANAGADQTITLPTSSATLTGSGSEVNGAIVSYTWSFVSGPSTVAPSPAGQAQTTVSGLVQGVYVFRLTIKDNSGVTATDDVTVTVNAAPVVPGNPVADAGADQTITLPTSSAKLSGTGSETNGTIVSYAWQELSGPSTATITTPGLASTIVSSLVQGVYTFVLTVKDNSGVTASDVVTVTVNAVTPPPPPPNQAPIANAGPDQTTSQTSGVQLDGSASYDPDGTIVKYSWIQTSGAGGVTLTGSNTVNPSIYGLTPGSYGFRLTVTDNAGATASDDMNVTVTAQTTPPPANGNQAPVAVVGNDTTVIYPNGNAASLNGSASYDANGTIVSYSWKQVSGPAAAALSGGSYAIASATALEVGDYVFELTVTDDKGDTASAMLTVHVKSNERSDGKMKLYPNPVFNQQVTVEGMNSYIGQVRVTLTDIGGRVVRVFEIDKKSPDFKQTLTLGSVSRGVYFLQIQFYLDVKPTTYKIVVD